MPKIKIYGILCLIFRIINLVFLFENLINFYAKYLIYSNDFEIVCGGVWFCVNACTYVDLGGID